MLQILLADDEPSLRLSVGDALGQAGHQVTLAVDGQAALELIEARDFDLVVSDIRMPRVDGITLFRAVQSTTPGTDVILITAYGSVDDAVQALKDGAVDYITKPFDTEELVTRVARVARRRALQSALSDAREALAEATPATEIIGSSRVVRQMLSRITTVARTDARVLIRGESGTGKELVARRLHALSTRANEPFVPVHGAAFPETLIESELFGHVRGAFTGANSGRTGRFQRADGGTLFLDEVAEISPTVQAKLLRVLQEGEVEPLGADQCVPVDVRVLCATHRDLLQMVEDGTFREDLYYRLNVIDIEVPPLRARTGDLTVLVEHFRNRFAGPGGPAPISMQAWSMLEAYPFPGNIRELEHAIQHASILSDGGEVEAHHLPRAIAGEMAQSTAVADTAPPLADALRAFEREYLQRALSVHDGAKAKAAEALGISRKNLWEKLKNHGLS